MPRYIFLNHMVTHGYMVVIRLACFLFQQYMKRVARGEGGGQGGGGGFTPLKAAAPTLPPQVVRKTYPPKISSNKRVQALAFRRGGGKSGKVVVVVVLILRITKRQSRFRRHKTGSANSGAEEIPRRKIKEEN